MVFKRERNIELVSDRIKEVSLKANEQLKNIQDITNKAAQIFSLGEIDNEKNDTIIKSIADSLDEQLKGIEEMQEMIKAITDKNHPINIAKREEMQRLLEIEHQHELYEFQEECLKITKEQYAEWLERKIPWHKKIFKNIEILEVNSDIQNREICQIIRFRIGKKEQSIIFGKWNLHEIIYK